MTLRYGPGDPGDENDTRADCDGTCVYCVEARTRPARANLEPLEAALDDVHLSAGMHALAYYIKQQEEDGDDRLLQGEFYDIEIRQLILVRAARLRQAVESEAKYQRPMVSGSGESGVL
jgi:hypothetical protein